MAKTVTGVIEKAELFDVYDLWRRKPRGLTFNDTDVIVITVESGGEKINETFFTCLKADGTFSLKTPNRIALARREKLARFLTYYNIAKNPEEYNIREGINQWKKKELQIVFDRGQKFVYIP